MGDDAVTLIVKVLTALIGVAILAVIVSRRAATADVLKAGGGAFSSILNAALGPIGSSGISAGTSLFGGGTGVGIDLGNLPVRIGIGRQPVG